MCRSTIITYENEHVFIVRAVWHEPFYFQGSYSSTVIVPGIATLNSMYEKYRFFYSGTENTAMFSVALWGFPPSC
jgi:hypothetical protein